MLAPEDVYPETQPCGCVAYTSPLGRMLDFQPCDECRTAAYADDETPRPVPEVEPPALWPTDEELPF